MTGEIEPENGEPEGKADVAQNTPIGSDGPEDFSGPAVSIEVRGPEPRGQGVNRKIIGGAVVLGVVLIIGVIWSSVQKQALIRRGASGGEIISVAENPPEPASTADLPSNYEELRRYNERQEAERRARQTRLGLDEPLPVLPASLAASDAIIPVGQTGRQRESELDPKDPRLVAARQAATQRLQQRAAAVAGDSAIQTRIAASPVVESYAGSSPPPAVPGTIFSTTPVDETIHANQQENKQAFLVDDRASDPYLRQSLIDPISGYQVMAGSVIPAALITGLNSDLPGWLTAQVRSNIYDSVTGEYLLIPQGARLIGEYSSRITYGQNRALVLWTRILFPNGASISLEGMPGVDLAGYAGFKDKVDHHFTRLFGAAVLGSLISTGANAAEDGDDGFSDDFLQGTANAVDQTVQQIIRKQLNIQPTIKIRPGFKFNVLVMADMVLRPYDPRPAYQTVRK